LLRRLSLGRQLRKCFAHLRRGGSYSSLHWITHTTTI
jgi:hypothetical protein